MLLFDSIYHVYDWQECVCVCVCVCVFYSNNNLY